MKKKTSLKIHVLFTRTILVISLILLFVPEILGQQYTLTGGSIGNSIPFANSSNNRREWIFYPSNFSTAPSGYITKIYIMANTSVSSTFTNFTLRMGPTTLNTFTAGPWITSGTDTVFYSASFSVSTISGNWIPITLQTPFYYNNTMNFIADVSQTGYTSGVTILQASVAGRSLYGGAGSASASLQGRLVNFGFDMLPPNSDAGILSIINPSDTICSGIKTVTVELKNFSTNPLSSATINWKVNNVNQTAYTWSGNLAAGSTANVNIGTFNFQTGVSYNVVTSTSNPNGVSDINTSNDTLTKNTVFVNASPLASIFPSGAINICQNDSLLLTANPVSGLTYQWFKDGIAISGETDTSLTVKQAGNYMVNVTNSIGCSTISDTAIVTVLPAPPATINALGATTFCNGDSVFITANIGSGLTYQWKKDGILIPGATSSTLFANESGAYTVTTTNLNSCSTTSLPINVTVMLPPLDLGPDSTICETHQITLDAGAGMDSYLWSTGDTTQTIIVDSTGIGIGNKNFSVIVTQQGCVNSDTIKVTVMDCSGISENIKLLGINIYPNPSQGKINIDIPEGLDGLEITVFNSIGQKILSELITTKSKIIKTIDLSELPKGVYYIGLKSKEKQKFVKVILN